MRRLLMKRLLFGRKGQPTLEYAVLVVLISAGLVLLSAYVRRGYQGRLRTSAERFGDQFEPGVTHYELITESEPVKVSNQVATNGDITVTRAGLIDGYQPKTKTTTDILFTPWGDNYVNPNANATATTDTEPPPG